MSASLASSPEREYFAHVAHGRFKLQRPALAHGNGCELSSQATLIFGTSATL